MRMKINKCIVILIQILTIKKRANTWVWALIAIIGTIASIITIDND